jgi:hypothetical protein
MCQFENVSTQKVWNHLQKVPLDMKEQLKEIKIVLGNWGGKTFFVKPSTRIALRFINPGMGGLDPISGILVKDF